MSSAFLQNILGKREWRVGTKLILLTVPLTAAVSLLAAFLEHARTTATHQDMLADRARASRRRSSWR